VGDAASSFHALLARDEAAAVEQAEWLRAAFLREGVTFDGDAMPSFLRPHFVARKDWDALRKAGVRVMDIATRVARDVFEGDAARLCDFLGTPESEAEWVTLDPGPPDVVLSRLDAFVTPSGPRFIEINSDAPAGFGYSDRMAGLFQQTPAFLEFAREHEVAYERSDDALVAAVVESWRRASGTGRPQVAIVDWADVKTRPDQEILRQAFVARGFECALADPREIVVSGGRLSAPGGAIDVVYRRAVLSELVARKDEVSAFLGAYRHRICPFVNSLRCRLAEDKAFFAVLTDEAFASLLDADERALVSRVLPWTRRVAERRTMRGGREVDLVPHIIEAREELVLKPAHSYGGRSVLLGSETEASEWEAAVLAALEAPWVVQERVAIPEETFPVVEAGRLAFVSLKVNANPFYVAGHEAGAVTRASRSSIINVAAGGGSVPTFVID